LPNALPSPANTRRDLTRGEPVIVPSDSKDPSADSCGFNIADCGQNSVFLSFRLAVEESENRTVPLK
jgi:hypothetical protein